MAGVKCRDEWEFDLWNKDVVVRVSHQERPIIRRTRKSHIRRDSRIWYDMAKEMIEEGMREMLKHMEDGHRRETLRRGDAEIMSGMFAEVYR